jgi:hypothetical protein
VRVPVYLAVAQWVLLIALGVLVVFMFRQLGRSLGAVRRRGSLGPPVGTPAAGFEYLPVSGAEPASESPGNGKATFFQPGQQRPSLIAFVDPTCPACEELVTSMNAADADRELERVSVLLLMSEPPGYLQISEAFRRTRLPLGRVRADSTLAAYRVSATPLLVAIDAEGVIRAAGPTIRREDVREFVRACLLPSAQETTLARQGG